MSQDDNQRNDDADLIVRRAVAGLATWMADAVANRCISGDASKLLAEAVEVELRVIQERVYGTPQTGAPDPMIRNMTLAELSRMYPEFPPQ